MGIELRLMHQSSSSFLNLSHVERFRLSCWEWDWQWRFWHIVAIIFCVYLFQFSMYFVVSEMRVIWVISCFPTVILIKSALHLQKLLKHVHTFWLNSLHYKMRLFGENTFWNITKRLTFIFALIKCILASKSWNKQVPSPIWMKILNYC